MVILDISIILFIIYFVIATLSEIRQENFIGDFNEMLAEYSICTSDFSILKYTITSNDYTENRFRLYLTESNRKKIVKFAKKNLWFEIKYKKILRGELI